MSTTEPRTRIASKTITTQHLTDYGIFGVVATIFGPLMFALFYWLMISEMAKEYNSSPAFYGFVTVVSAAASVVGPVALFIGRTFETTVTIWEDALDTTKRW
ncbi:hypothetical protein [Rhizobium sp. LjRoot254]|uniref:hypothetical protein n=1 Tax=Rhizobium sp. LjRoot254 TaxID=3342297 RepID=UPI003ED04145